MGKVIMDGHVKFDSARKAANWLHATGQTRASDPRHVAGNVSRAVNGSGNAYGHRFERAD